MKKNERGVFETFGDEQVAMCQWKDNRPVCLTSNFHEAEPISMAQKWSAIKRSHAYISQPHVAKAYNKHMGGVDLLDRFISDYTVDLLLFTQPLPRYRGHGGRLWSPRSQATPQGLDQKS